MTERQPSASTDENGNREDVMSERFTLPVLPLRDTVVYPGVAVPISAGRPGTVEAVQEALDGESLKRAIVAAGFAGTGG